jgi:hypothetical protein
MTQGKSNKVVTAGGFAALIVTVGFLLASVWERRLLRQLALYMDAQLELRRESHGDESNP